MGLKLSLYIELSFLKHWALLVMQKAVQHSVGTGSTGQPFSSAFTNFIKRLLASSSLLEHVIYCLLKTQLQRGKNHVQNPASIQSIQFNDFCILYIYICIYIYIYNVMDIYIHATTTMNIQNISSPPKFPHAILQFTTPSTSSPRQPHTCFCHYILGGIFPDIYINKVIQQALLCLSSFIQHNDLEII